MLVALHIFVMDQSTTCQLLTEIDEIIFISLFPWHSNIFMKWLHWRSYSRYELRQNNCSKKNVIKIITMCYFCPPSQCFMNFTGSPFCTSGVPVMTLTLGTDITQPSKSKMNKNNNLKKVKA